MRFAEFFAGIGLVRLALEPCGFQAVFANDIDPDKFAIYGDNFPSSDFRLGDIHAIDADEIPDADLFTASFPCTDLSIAGAMNGINSGESSAFWGFIELLRGLGQRKPRLILLENVLGFLMSREGNDLRDALSALNALDYAVDVFAVNAARFVPQSRVRLFVVAKLGVSGAYPFGLAATAVRPEPIVQFILRHPEIAWDVAELPPPPQKDVHLHDIIEALPDDDAAWWSQERAEYFLGQLSDKHRAIADSMIDADEISYGAAFRRVRKGKSMAELRTDGLAGCLRTPRGGSGRQILFKAGQGRYQVRLMTPRECARLQGVPDSFQINASANKALFGFGDAVCVPVIEWIAKEYLIPQLAAAGARDDSAEKAESLLSELPRNL